MSFPKWDGSVYCQQAGENGASGGPSYTVDLSGNCQQVLEQTAVASGVCLADTVPGKYAV